MAHSETRGWGRCNCCGGAVAIKENRSGMAYYRCDHCGVEVRHHWAKTSSGVLQPFAGAAPVDEDEAPPAANRSESQPKKAPSALEIFMGGGKA